MSIKVELKRHTGERKVRGKLQTVELPQFKVYVGGDFVGYVSSKPGKPFLATRPAKDILPEELEAINAEIAKLHGGQQPPEAVHVPEKPDGEDEAISDTDLPSDDEVTVTDDEVTVTDDEV